MTYGEIITINKVIAEFDGWYRDLEVNKGSEVNYFHKDKSTWITDKIMLICLNFGWLVMNLLSGTK